MNYETNKVGEGRYQVRAFGLRIPGEVLGGNRRWVVLFRGHQYPGVFLTRKAACEKLYQLNQTKGGN
jgi:hypothetical protein